MQRKRQAGRIRTSSTTCERPKNPANSDGGVREIVTRAAASRPLRNLVLVLGDQLNRDSAAFDGFDVAFDAVWMSETPNETTHVWCHKLRIAFFLSAMRHFRDALAADGRVVHYAELADDAAADLAQSFSERLTVDVQRLRPARLILAEPGDHRVRAEITETARALEVELDLRLDRTFLCSTDEFAVYAAGHKGLLLENFYRWMRKRHRILLEKNGAPIGGHWNFDKDNRGSFGRAGPGNIRPPAAFERDETTKRVCALVARRFADHPGSLDFFDLPVTREQALLLLSDFVEHRLSEFGKYQDAMWTDQPFLFHSRLSAALNVKLITAREVIDAALAAASLRQAPLSSVEGFVRQILGWREFMRGVYWLLMPEYAKRNSFDADRSLPEFYWTAQTDMRCMQQCTQQVIDHAYAHHIQRLMVLGNFALLYGVRPIAFHDWHMAMYTDAIDWVSLPNALGMSQHADGGVVGTKPYVASGNYINRMSNYCASCRYDPKKSVGADACPFNTLYWDFIDRHREKLKRNPRMRLPLKLLETKARTDVTQIRTRAMRVRESIEQRRLPT